MTAEDERYERLNSKIFQAMQLLHEVLAEDPEFLADIADELPFVVQELLWEEGQEHLQADEDEVVK